MPEFLYYELEEHEAQYVNGDQSSFTITTSPLIRIDNALTFIYQGKVLCRIPATYDLSQCPAVLQSFAVQLVQYQAMRVGLDGFLHG